MNRVNLWVRALIVLGLLGPVGTAAADFVRPSQTGQFTLKGLSQAEVQGVFRLMLTYKNGSTKQLKLSGGSSVLSSFKVNTFSPKASTTFDGFANSWNADATQRGRFKMRNVSVSRLAGTTVVDRASISTFDVSQRVVFAWDAATQTLFVTVFRPTSDQEKPGPVKILGAYNVTATTTTSVETGRDDSSFSLRDPKYLVNISLTKEKLAAASKIKLVIGNLPARLDLGRLGLARLQPNELFLELGQDFLTDGKAEVDRPIGVVRATCKVTVTGSAAIGNGNGAGGAGGTGGAGGGGAVMPGSGTDKTGTPIGLVTVVQNTTTECDGNQSAFLAHIKYEAHSAQIEDGETQTQSPVGQQFRHVLRIVDGPKGGLPESSFDARMLLSSFTNWFLNVAPAPNVSGFAFDIGSPESKSKPFVTIKAKSY